MTKAKIKGPQRMGASAMDEGDLTRAVVASYSGLTQDEAREAGQDAAALVLPARRRLWSLAEKLVPQRLAAALRARCGSDDATAREGVRELRMALADWLDPPPVCRWCRAPIRQGDEERACPRRSSGLRKDREQVHRKLKGAALELIIEPVFARNRIAHVDDRLAIEAAHLDLVECDSSGIHGHAGKERQQGRSVVGGIGVHGRHPSTRPSRPPVTCKPSKRRPLGAVARCGTLAFPAGVVSLEVMAATLRVPKGAAKGYDVACDRDARALTVATSDGPPPGRDLGDPDAWQDETIRRMYAAVAELGIGPGPQGIIQVAGHPIVGTLAKHGIKCHSDVIAGGDAGKDAGGNLLIGGEGGLSGVHGHHVTPRPVVCQAPLTDKTTGQYRSPLPPQIVEARAEWRRLRGEAIAANGRALLGIQTRYYAPRDGVCRADLVQGAAIGADRGLADYDAAQSRYTTYGADWMRQGCGEAWGDRDLVGTPEWVHALRCKLEDRLPGHTRAEVLRCVEALADAAHAASPASTRAKASALAEDLARLVLTGAEVRENVLGSRPARYVRHPMFADQSDDAVASHAASLLKKAKGDGGKAKKANSPGKSTGAVAAPVEAEDPERIRERIGDWLGKRLRLAKASGAGILAALRHGAPVFVQVGAGGDDEDDAQGTDGAGGLERQAAVLAAPDEEAAQLEEDLAAKRWQAALKALAALRSSGGKEAAEVVRRHHGLDSIAEDRGGQTGESFQSIGSTGLACSGRTLNKEAVRKIYQRGIAVMQDYIAGKGIAADLLADADDAEDYSPVIVPRSPFKPLPAPHAAPASSSPTVPVLVTPATPSPAWDAWREQVDGVRW